jgi:hypothetical protein
LIGACLFDVRSCLNSGLNQSWKEESNPLW